MVVQGWGCWQQQLLHDSADTASVGHDILGQGEVVRAGEVQAGVCCR